MGKRRYDEPQTYIIPKNFLDSGYVFGGRIKQRNFIEAALLTAPVLGVFVYGWKVAGWRMTNTIAACVILCSAVFFAAASGVGGDSLLEFLKRVQHFRKHKQISKYNPRVKLESKPDFLLSEKQSLPREKLLGLVKGLEGKILGDDGLPISADISDEKLIVYYEGDEKYVEKPDQLKSHAELRAETKAAKKREKKRRRQEKAIIKSLPHSERKEARKAYRLDAQVRAAEEKRQRNQDRLQAEARIRAALEAAQEQKRNMAKSEESEKPGCNLRKSPRNRKREVTQHAEKDE